MEGKCVLFKAFGDVDAFPLCIKSHDVDEIVNTIYLISGMPSEPRASDIIPIAVLSLILSLAATVYPSWRASRIRPAEALRYE